MCPFLSVSLMIWEIRKLKLSIGISTRNYNFIFCHFSGKLDEHTITMMQNEIKHKLFKKTILCLYFILHSCCLWWVCLKVSVQGVKSLWGGCSVCPRLGTWERWRINLPLCATCQCTLDGLSTRPNPLIISKYLQFRTFWSQSKALFMIRCMSKVGSGSKMLCALKVTILCQIFELSVHKILKNAF